MSNSIFGTITVLNKLPRTKTIGGIVIDGFLTESHSKRANVTQLPVENGATISDHVQVQPDRVTVTGKISNTPMLLTMAASLNTGTILGDRVSAINQQLDRILKEAQEITIATSLQIYTSMIMEEYTPVKNGETGQSMDFTASFVKIKKTSNQTVKIPNNIIGGDLQTDQLQAQNNVAQGQTVSQPDTPVTQSVDSILSLVADQLGAL